MKDILRQIDGFMERYRLVDISLVVYLFLLPFPRFAGIRNSAFALMVVYLTMRLINGNAGIDFRDRTVRALFILAGTILLSTAVSPYPLDSLTYVRKYLLYQMVTFFIIITRYRDLDGLKPVLYSLIFSFATLSVVIVLKNDPSVIINWLDELERMTPEQRKETFFLGYSLHATFYIPILIGYIYAVSESRRMKIVLVGLFFLEMVLVYLHQHRSQFVSVLLAIAVTTLVARRYRLFAVCFMVVTVVAGIFAFTRPEVFGRYTSLLSPETYLTNEHRGWNERFGIWSGTIEMIRERPLTGYGYGWKKMAWVVRDGGFLERWDEDSDAYRYFIKHGYGGTNPHNLLLQILFEVGIIGLCAFVYFWVVVIRRVVVTVREGGGEGVDFLKYTACGVFVAYGVVNITNGLWEETGGVLMLSFAGICYVLSRR